MRDLILDIILIVICLFDVFHSAWNLLDIKRTNDIFNILTKWRVNNDSRFMDYGFSEMERIYRNKGWTGRFRKLKEDDFPPKAMPGDDVYTFTREHKKLMLEWLSSPNFLSSLDGPESAFLGRGNVRTYTTSDKPILNSIRNKWIAYLKFKKKLLP